MPPFSPCGLAVEWVRSSHHGFWRFWSNRPALMTGGSFYFVPDDTPHLHCPHNFGTSDWRKGDPIQVQQLGEVADVDWKWHNGRAGTRPVPAVAIGTCADFASDWNFPPPNIDRRNLCGIDSRCFTNLRLTYVERECLCNLEELALQLIYARLIELMYYPDDVVFRAFILAWMGPFADVTIYPVAGNLPAMAIIHAQEFTFAVISGTDNFQQLALQGFQALQGATNYGNFSTVPLWMETSITLERRMKDCGMTEDQGVIMTGHSYGGCVAVLTAARMRAANADRDICVMTFGLPKPGDVRLREILQTVNEVDVLNDIDIVGNLPPNARELAPLGGIVGALISGIWSRYVARGERWVLDFTGEGQWSDPPAWDTAVLRPIVARALAGLPSNPIEAHDIREYLRRLQRQVCDPECCVLPDQWAIIFPDRPCVPLGLALEGEGDVSFDAEGGLELGGAGLVAIPSSGGFKLGGQTEHNYVGTGGFKVGGVAELGPIGAAGMMLGGAGVVAFGSSVGISLGGAGSVETIGSGGFELGGAGELTTSPQLGSGGFELGGTADLSTDPQKGTGGFELGGAGVVTSPVVPGTTCAGAGTMAFDTDYTFNSPAIGIDWFRFPIDPSTTYYVKWTVNSGMGTSCSVETGSCGLSAPQFTLLGTGCNTFTSGMVASDCMILIPGSLFGTFNYTIRAGVGSCPP